MTTPGSADKPVDPSPIPRDILDTNNPPAEYDHPALREFVSRGSARRAYLDAKIAPLKAELAKLLEERESLDAEVRKHEGALSPLRGMPVEIISLIFKFAAPFRSDVMNVEEGPWVLSAVCSQWRIIALSQPSLWNGFVLNFTDDGDSPGSAGRTLLPLVEAHLERSQKLPLTITFSPFHEIECTEAEQALLDLLAAHCDRWETVELYGSTLLYDTLIGRIYGRLPILRKLDIRVCSQFDEQDDDPEVDISYLFAACPALQEVFINDGCYGGCIPVIADLPCAQLLRYSASNHWPNHVRVLTSAINLVDCVLRLIDPVRVPAPGSPVVLLPQLRRLSTSTAAALDYLETPALQELYCCDHSSRLHSYLKRLPTLQRLFVADTQSAADIGSLLHAAPTITNLFLYLPIPFAPDLFALLENPTPPADGQPATLPALDTLSLCLISLDRTLGGLLDEDYLMRTVEAQFQRGSLRSLHLYATNFVPSATTLERMEALRAQGMQIVLYERSYSLYSEMVSPDFQLYDVTAL
ncbi:hypothetical protein B0H14DRAFT_3858482 [Mycena olivaceomarginata]|nr:hypothetical protein B0H14DRAFT_3858482 [Mycena olivaceomarginata]